MTHKSSRTRVTLRGVAAVVTVSVLHPQLAMTAARALDSCVTPDRTQVLLPGGTFLMGSREHVGQVTVVPFWMDHFDVTNGEFAKFVAATGYVTAAEREPDAKDYSEIPRDQLTSGGAVFRPHDDDAPSENGDGVSGER